MDGTQAAAAPSGAAAAAGGAPAIGEQATLGGVLERADALAVASPADAEPLYRRIIDGQSDLVVAAGDDVNVVKQAAIVGALALAEGGGGGLVGICRTLGVLCGVVRVVVLSFVWCTAGCGARASHVSLAYSAFSLSPSIRLR